MSSPLENRVVVMSGGSRGIGLAIAVALARAGARIALLAVTSSPAITSKERPMRLLLQERLKL